MGPNSSTVAAKKSWCKEICFPSFMAWSSSTFCWQQNLLLTLKGVSTLSSFLWLKKSELWIASECLFKFSFNNYIYISFCCLRKNRQCWFFFGVSILICGTSRWSWNFKWENANAAQGTCVGLVFHMGNSRDELQNSNKSHWAIAKICSHDLRISLTWAKPLETPIMVCESAAALLS